MQIRDWLHVTDHCEAIKCVLERGKIGETYCIGGNNEQPNLHIVHRICDLVDQRLGQAAGTARNQIRHVEDRPGHDRRYAIDANKIQQELGWRPRFEFDSVLPSVVDWYMDSREWVDNIRSGEYLRFYDEQYGKRLGEK